jgi:hypothetical protein
LRAAPKVDLVLALSVLHHLPNVSEVLSLMRARATYVAVVLPGPSEEAARKLPANPYEFVRERLGASVVWECAYEGRVLQFLRVNA